MIPWMYVVVFNVSDILANNYFSSLFTLTAFCCNWPPLGMMEEMIRSHDPFKIFFTSTARFIILVAISVSVESLLRSFVPACIMTTSAFGFFFIGGFV